MGLEPLIFAEIASGTVLQRLRSYSFFRATPNPDSTGGFRGLPDSSNPHQLSTYSAAAANERFALADDTMKSEMRGTISDRKREPLNTP
jgi:hypothetical protein